MKRKNALPHRLSYNFFENKRHLNELKHLWTELESNTDNYTHTEQFINQIELFLSKEYVEVRRIEIELLRHSSFFLASFRSECIDAKTWFHQRI
jgi:hypothetical protein